MMSDNDKEGLRQLEAGSEKTEQIVSKARTIFRDGERSGCKIGLKAWTEAVPSSSSPCLMAESSGSVPFRKNILREWNIVDEDTLLPDAVAASKDRNEVGILVRFPSSLLSDDLKKGGEMLEDSGCLGVDFDKVDWKTFSPQVPVLIHFHGGAMNIGCPNDSILTMDTARLVQNASSQGPRDIITVSVDYGLAPDNPFPIGIMDALSVVDYFLRENSIRKGIHLTGTSAGANLSLVAGFEGFRRFPGRILSIQSQSPMLDPSCASMSYYMNQSAFPDINWLRWSWQAYLGLEKPSPATPAATADDDDEPELQKVLRKDTNHTAWEKWKTESYPSEVLHRLVNPLLGIPDGLDDNDDEDETSEKRPPAIIVRYNLGDPLYDDGRAAELALRQKAGSNATYYEESGLHCAISRLYDPDAPPEYWKVWSDAIFGVGDGRK
eukprot:jgi/Psemu1/322644/estExt_fgenesh1_pg.C_350034